MQDLGKKKETHRYSNEGKLDLAGFWRLFPVRLGSVEMKNIAIVWLGLDTNAVWVDARQKTTTRASYKKERKHAQGMGE